MHKDNILNIKSSFINKLNFVNPVGWNILIGTLFSRIGTSMSIPFLSIYLTTVKHISPETTGLIVASSSFIGIFTSFYGGALTDFFGKKIIIIISVFLWAAVFMGFSLCNSIFSFFLINVLNGLCQSIFEPSARVLLSDLVDKENRLFIFNLRYTAINLGVVLGPFIGFKIGSAKTTFPFVIAGSIYFIYGLSLLYTLSKYNINTSNNEIKKVKIYDALKIVQSDKMFFCILLGVILTISGYAQFSSTLPQYFSVILEDGVQTFSIFLSLNAIVVILTQYPIIRFMKKFNPLNSIICGNILISVSLLCFSFSDSKFIITLLVILFSIGEVLVFSMVDLIIDIIAKPNLKGTYFGAIGFNRLGNVIGPWIGGLLINNFINGNRFFIFIFISAITLSGIPLLIFARCILKRVEFLDV